MSLLLTGADKSGYSIIYFFGTMGCFTVLKSRKKKTEQIVYSGKWASSQEHSPTTLPEPRNNTRSLQSAPPSFRTRVKPIHTNTKVINSRTRALSAPSSLVAAEEDALTSNDYEEQEEFKSRGSSKKEYQSPSPQPLPLPSPQSTAALKTMGSFKVGNTSGPLNASGPLPLPPTAPPTLPPSGTLRSFSFEELAAACLNFSPERCMSEGLSSVMYRASFGDDNSSSRKLEATVTRLHPSNQVCLWFLSVDFEYLYNIFLALSDVLALTIYRIWVL